MKFVSYYVFVWKKLFRRSSAVYLASALCIILSPNNGIAKSPPTVYTTPVLKAPYTLVFKAQIQKPAKRWLKDIGQKNIQQVGKITVSYNGQRFLYYARFGKWRSVAICDMTTDTAYNYENDVFNAIILPQVDNGLSAMRLLPMPGVGYDVYPMFQSFDHAGAMHTHGTMAYVGAVSGVTNNVVKGMQYSSTAITLGHWSGHTIVSNCQIFMPTLQPLTDQTWSFSGYRLFASIPIAGTIDRATYLPTVPGKWPPTATKLDGQIRYTLIGAYKTSLPDQRYHLEYYLPAGTAVTDYRKNP